MASLAHAHAAQRPAVAHAAGPPHHHPVRGLPVSQREPARVGTTGGRIFERHRLAQAPTARLARHAVLQPLQQHLPLGRREGLTRVRIVRDVTVAQPPRAARAAATVTVPTAAVRARERPVGEYVEREATHPAHVAAQPQPQFARRRVAD